MAFLQGAVKMTGEILPNSYDAVIADLQAKRDQIDQAIALLTALRTGASPTTGAALSTTESGITETAGMFLGMSIVDATKKLLALRKRTMGNVHIARELQAGGLVLTGKDPTNVVGSVLTRRFNDVGDVVKVGRGIWGLKEWYPGRNFKQAPKSVAVADVPEEVWDEVDKSLGWESASEPDNDFDDLRGSPSSAAEPVNRGWGQPASTGGGFADDLDDDIPF